MSSTLQQNLTHKLRTHLVVGRVSNLPTVWSNCIAAWALVSGAFVPTLFIVTAGITLIYLGGMYLNDALDAPWDVKHKKDRPIARGEISQQLVLAMAVVFLALGAFVIFGEGWGPFGLACVLVALVVAYNFVHKRIEWSPLLIAPARGLVYLTIGVAAVMGLNDEVLVWALLLTLYVAGLSYVAKVEETNVFKRYAPLLLMLLPGLWNVYLHRDALPVALTIAYFAWLAYAFVFIFTPRIRNLKRAVSAMLAGICLVDLLAVTQTLQPGKWQIAIVGFFILALIFQRYIPAT